MKHSFKPFDRVLVRDADDDVWRCQFYSHPYERLHACLDGVHAQCIPYVDNELLLGTTNGPEPELKKGDIVLVWDESKDNKYVRVYSHFDKKYRQHMVYASLFKDGARTEVQGWGHAEKFVPATVEGQEGA